MKPVLDAYYSGLGPAGFGLATSGLGWYYDLGVQYLRMIFSARRLLPPELLGGRRRHGERTLPAVDRGGRRDGPDAVLTDYPYTFGTRPGDYPFLDTSGGVARSFLERAPFTDEEKAAIGSGNWERLVGRSQRAAGIAARI